MKAYEKDYIEIKPLSNKVLDYSKELKKEIVFRTDVQPFSYLLLIINDIKTKYSVDTEDILMLFYLNELGVFKSVVNLEVDKKTNISKFVDKNLIERDFSIKEKTLYKLSKTAIDIILDIRDSINDVGKFALYNRELTIDVHSKAKRVISNMSFED